MPFSSASTPKPRLEYHLPRCHDRLTLAVDFRAGERVKATIRTPMLSSTAPPLPAIFGATPHLLRRFAVLRQSRF
jgi:hypothetical protein